MHRLDYPARHRASRIAVPYDQNDRTPPAMALATAMLPAAGILLACVIMLSTIQ